MQEISSLADLEGNPRRCCYSLVEDWRNNSWIGIDALGNTIAGLALMFFLELLSLTTPLSQSIFARYCRMQDSAPCEVPPPSTAETFGFLGLFLLALRFVISL